MQDKARLASSIRAIEAMVDERIEVAPETGVPFIRLRPDEEQHYQGAGEYLAAFDGRARLVEMRDVIGEIEPTGNLKADSNTALEKAREFVAEQTSKGRAVYCVMASCHVLCEPESVSSPLETARLARRLGDALIGFADF